ncbi:MAG TPA: hypothetical protein PKY61_00015 [bacterium]|jgi:hypothetical protein|nr:MAG: hypothetical protein BWX82_00662 [Parcubacteria group bacterium ADurb.Bin115]HOD87280.1 hypothetical protein [bacterium]HPY99516.1 hypothetical protein [bacterium]HQB75985.1 hypothetical protein [bacterium]HQL34312.1 hypothetical protein [bacterium]
MKIIIDNQRLGGASPAQWLRRAGYTLINDRQRGQESFVRRLSRDFYPRFHLYVQEREGGGYFFNLHLDHKKASYEGQSRHSADYDGEMVEQEAARLSSLLLPPSVSSAPIAGGNIQADVLTTLKPSFKPPLAPKRSWWQRLFS